MAVVGHIGDDGFFLYAEDRLAALALPLFLCIKVRPRSSLHPSPVKAPNHVSSGRAITPTPLVQQLLCQSLWFCSVQHINADFCLLQMVYNCNLFKRICQIFIPDLRQCKCVSWGVRQGGELIELDECFCATMCCRLVWIKLKWVGWWWITKPRPLWGSPPVCFQYNVLIHI